MWEEEEEKKKPPGAAPAPGRAGRAAPRCLFSATFPVVCNIEFVFFSFIFVFFFSPLPLLLSLSLSLHSDPFAVGAFFGLYSFPSLPSPSPPPSQLLPLPLGPKGVEAARRLQQTPYIRNKSSN